MKAYKILLHDTRDAWPIVLSAEMARDARAVEFARERLDSSPHLASIEVWSGPTKVCGFRRELRQAA